MRLWIAIKAFLKAFSDPKKAQLFLEEPSTAPRNSLECDPSHLRLLALLQQSGRLIDFLKEDISSYSDVQVGAAVRKIHQDCGQSLEEYVTIRPVTDEDEGAKIKIDPGYDPSEIKIVGQFKGEFPLTGKVIHRGWKAHKRSLPKKVGEQSNEILCPAEIEVK
ncbi:MAG: DUF2760 domain-containing protein [Parachlamydiaceae bacterium]